jgi:hypothetical protein
LASSIPANSLLCKFNTVVYNVVWQPYHKNCFTPIFELFYTLLNAGESEDKKFDKIDQCLVVSENRTLALDFVHNL